MVCFICYDDIVGLEFCEAPLLISEFRSVFFAYFFFSSRRRHTRWTGDWSSDVCSSDLGRDHQAKGGEGGATGRRFRGDNELAGPSGENIESAGYGPPRYQVLSASRPDDIV